ncbi:hypothetical protein PRCB_01245 [Pantoea rodasii]|uniref:Uncharacterized protein n=1 Tax=Pantoea rodasii TaxID=1076549 RepID=A0A2M9WIC9_9GAMM|nr:hypothetical protein HA45_10155 [Pantoea rodasii]PJZ07320.1 hypothetical protein PRCB_01245 [Pantoea rodasii]
MYKYLIIYPEQYEVYQSAEIFSHKQRIDINGSTFISELYHFDRDGPYGILIKQFNPVGHSRIREAIKQANIPTLPQV